ncbi:MAG TPA: amidohydrolase family protein, partial [Longimicrobiales bacterium]
PSFTSWQATRPPARPAVADGAGVLLLEGALVVTCDDAFRIGAFTVAVAGGRIVAVDAPAAMRARFLDAPIHDCRGRILLPGLVNAHLHPELQILKGAVEERSLHDWDDADHFDGALAVLHSPEGRELQRAAIRLALADCLLSGTTMVGVYGITSGANDIAAEEMARLGVRGEITVRDVAFASLPPQAPAHRYRVHAEEALTEAELRAAGAALARGEALVMHAAETAHRLKLARELFGTTTIRLLERHGLLGPRTLLSHAVHIDAEECELLARSGTPVVSSPTAELKLADGVAPMGALVAAGGVVALGTDAAVCNNSNDMFLEMRQFGLVQKLRYGAAAVPAEQILRIATRGGAGALGVAATGALAPGWAADLVLVQADGVRLQPLVHRPEHSNVAANLVYAATGGDVTDVMVAGQWRVRDRVLLAADGSALTDLLTDLGRAAARLYDRVL